MTSAQEFLQAIERKFRNKQKSYMMVTFLCLLDSMNSDGIAEFNTIAESFKQFYERRLEYGKSTEAKGSKMFDPNQVNLSQIKALLLENPLKALEDFIVYDENQKQLKLRETVLNVYDDVETELRKITHRHLYEYYRKDIHSGSPYITLKDLQNIPQQLAVSATDIAYLSGHNRLKGIHPIEVDEINTVIVLCTLSGEHYPNQWINEDALKYYLEGRKNAEGKKIYNEQSQSNQSVIRSKEKNYPVHVFVREKSGDLFHYEGPFVYHRVAEDEHGHKYFELVRRKKNSNRISLPDVSREIILEALVKFDQEKRKKLEWSNWDLKESQLYAILHNGQKYPPKEIISISTGVSKDKFSGGDQSNRYLQKRGFEIINLRERDIKPNIRAKSIVDRIYHHITGKGLVYDYEFIANLYLSLKAKPFVILAGISGTGKSKLVEQFAYAVGATNNNGRFTLIPVRPDWNDSSDLLGYRNLQGEFIVGPLTRVIQAAEKDPDHPYFVCLDEMNLARVEYYFSDFLSIIEFREKVEEKIISSSLLFDGLSEALSFPENLYVIGTVNMDETTHSFSRKVLDRANTIEFSEVHLGRLPMNQDEGKEPLLLENIQLKSNYLTLKDCINGNETYLREKIQVLEELNKILITQSLHVGYRVRDEFSFYLLYNKEGALLDEDVAVDFQILQKILPRIQGSSSEIETLLNQLMEYCGEKYPRSRAKIEFMLRRLGDDGFTSFWL